jgi:hypothetical protein
VKQEEERDMRLTVAFLVVVTVACVVFAGCGGAKNPLLGKWQDTKIGMMTFEFTADGKMTVSAMGQSQTGSHKVEGNKITMTGPGAGDKGESQPFVVNGDTLTIGEGMGAISFKRAK